MGGTANLGVEVAMAAKDELGKRGEQVAVDHLVGRGYRIIERNWRCTQGEIDIVAADTGGGGDETVFVEVKTRSSVAYGHPFEAITAQKLARLRRLAAAWCAAHPGQASRVRIDAMAVIAPRGEAMQVEHLERVF
jgi:putative endonuclease